MKLFRIVAMLVLLSGLFGGGVVEAISTFDGDEVDGQQDNVTAPPMKHWPPGLDYPQCEPYLLQGSTQPVRVGSRLRLSDEAIGDFGTKCSDILQRGYYPQTPLSKDEAEFPIAFATNVFKDYAMVEKVFHVMYQPQNFYCFSIDSKADPVFKERIRNLASCFSNVVVPEEELDVKSTGVNTPAAHLSCMRSLQPFKWNYLILLQNHDFPLRTNAELVEILKVFGGANDVSTMRPTPTSLNESSDTTFPFLHIFRDVERNKELYKGHFRRLRPSKSLVGVSLSRSFVDWILGELDVSAFIAQLEQVEYGVGSSLLSVADILLFVLNFAVSVASSLTANYVQRGVDNGWWGAWEYLSTTLANFYRRFFPLPVHGPALVVDALNIHQLRVMYNRAVTDLNASQENLTRERRLHRHLRRKYTGLARAVQTLAERRFQQTD